MKPLARMLIGVCILCCPLFAQSNPPATAPGTWQEPENHAVAVERLLLYHDSGEYGLQIRQVANAARDYLRERLKNVEEGEKFAAVFDVDETSLSNWAAMSGCGFCSYTAQKKLYPDSQDPAITPVLELFRYARKNGVAIFFLTGRSESERAATVKNLNEAGYTEWADLIMKPNNNNEPAHVFKPRERQKIEGKGYRIVLNIGDQASDLSGCCAERVFKLPNPFYLVR